MATLGDLERAVMELLWSAPDPLTATALRDRLQTDDRSPAVTTILTVLTRLEAKAFVSRDRGSRPHSYSPVMSREAHTAALMHEVLGSASDRDAVLARFVGQVSVDEAHTLRALLDPGR
ncbi:BlaI/MecI/CopY family transcriptional regulator [Glaciibacter flavus]|uniref:BlaI/MecI/CopY family transcriptional regulator n=1 Tax=Orlajensenia flava TaxID=2565934 RepID=UPI003AFFA4C8